MAACRFQCRPPARPPPLPAASCPQRPAAASAAAASAAVTGGSTAASVPALAAALGVAAAAATRRGGRGRTALRVLAIDASPSQVSKAIIAQLRHRTRAPLESLVGRKLCTECPACGGGPQGFRTMTLRVEEGTILYACCWKNCRQKGRMVWPPKQVMRTAADATTQQVKRQRAKLEKWTQDDWMRWLERERRIPREVLERNEVHAKELDRGGGHVLVFPYRANGEVVATKYRGVGKRFWKAEDSKTCLYGVDDLEDQKVVILVEGELDKLSVEAAGCEGVASVPNGAAASAESVMGFGAKEAIEAAEKVVLATDADDPGQECARNLASAVGWEKCKLVVWREGCKDANEVLVKHGASAVAEDIDRAVPAAGRLQTAAAAPRPARAWARGPSKERPSPQQCALAAEMIWHDLSADGMPIQRLVGQRFRAPRVMCPFCGGGERRDNAFSVKVEDGYFRYTCFRGKCGQQGRLDLPDAAYIPEEGARPVA